VPQRAFMRALRAASGIPVGLPATRWMAELGAFVLRSDTELLLKSRRVVPGRLLEAGFAFEHPEWPQAADDLVRRRRGRAVA
jgi:NAD dependent epimerase/dehydratase family enzyme